MNKDVIYIDVEDDITAIISKVKASKSKVVAMVPPKRIGVLQSAVNLRLLARAAKQADKHLAIVTSNQSLIALASAAAIPVAKNLQSKPELAEVDPVIDDDEEDIIEGAALPIGDHATQGGNERAKDTRDAAMAAALAEAPKGDATPKKPKSKSKVPNFNTFRKRLVLAIIAFILLIGFFVWAIFFAPRATVVISAKTTSSSVNLPVTLSPDVETSSAKNTIKAAVQEQDSDKSEKFTATGKKDAGKQATGTVDFRSDSLSAVSQGITIPSGTALTSQSGKVFTTDSTVQLTIASGGQGSVGVTAKENGSSYNSADGAMSGAPSTVSADLSGPTSGGVSKTVTVVTAADVQKAKQSLVDGSTDDIKKELKQKFGDGTTVIDQSFAIDYGDVQTSPAVGEEASEATLTTTITYSLYGVQKSEVNSFVDAYLKDQLKDSTTQRVYDNGSDKALFQEASAAKNGAKATLIATAQIGPKVDDSKVKDLSKGKRYGEIQQALEGIQGVDSVDVKFFPFWINTVPDNDDRITVDFNLEEQ